MVKKKSWSKREFLHLGVELILTLAAVLVFRSSWLILDRYNIFNSLESLIIMLTVGILGTIICVDYLVKHEREH